MKIVYVAEKCVHAYISVYNTVYHCVLTNWCMEKLFTRDGSLIYRLYTEREKHDVICFPCGFIS